MVKWKTDSELTKEQKKVQYFTVRQTLNNLTRKEYETLKYLCHISKNLANEAMYLIRQHFFETKEYLPYLKVQKILQETSMNYKILNANVAQHIIAQVGTMYMSFFELLEKKKRKEIEDEIKIPHYLDKDGFFPLYIEAIPDSITKHHSHFLVPYSRKFKKINNVILVNLPICLKDKTIKRITIVPKYDAKIFEVHYTYELKKEPVSYLDSSKVLAIDLGVDNFVTCVTSDGDSFIIDGKKVKSFNQWYNKRISELTTISFKQGILTYTKQQYMITQKYVNRMTDFTGKVAKYIVMYCIRFSFGNIILGFGPDLQRNLKLGNSNNQMISQMPYGQFKKKLKHLCEHYGIKCYEQEESYTSMASFFDHDDIPVFDKDNPKPKGYYTFSGKRIKRGLYQTKDGYLVNADVNAALNIMKKGTVARDLPIPQFNRGDLNPPVRIRLYK